MSTARPTTVYFELGPHDRFFRGLWESNLARWVSLAPAEVRLVGSAGDAEFIVETSVPQNLNGGHVFRVSPNSRYARDPERTFAWDSQDLPTGRLPGLYCSLPRALHDPRRHRSFCYPYRYNPHLRAAAPGEADRHFGFTGTVTSPLRGRLFAVLGAESAASRGLLRRTESIWGRMFTADDDSAKRRYCEDLARCKFILCPRGNGVCSVRLFESLEAARVPVILSDRYVLPDGIDWSACALRVPERDLGRLPALLAACEAGWPEMATRARTVWEQNFSDNRRLARLAAELQAIAAARREPERRSGPRFWIRVLPPFAVAQLKRLHRNLPRPRRGAPPAPSSP